MRIRGRDMSTVKSAAPQFLVGPDGYILCFSESD